MWCRARLQVGLVFWLSEDRQDLCFNWSGFDLLSRRWIGLFLWLVKNKTCFGSLVGWKLFGENVAVQQYNTCLRQDSFFVGLVIGKVLEYSIAKTIWLVCFYMLMSIWDRACSSIDCWVRYLIVWIVLSVLLVGNSGKEPVCNRIFGLFWVNCDGIEKSN